MAKILTPGQANAAHIAITAAVLVGGSATVTVGDLSDDAVRVFSEAFGMHIRVIRVQRYFVVATERYSDFSEFAAAYKV